MSGPCGIIASTRSLLLELPVLVSEYDNKLKLFSDSNADPSLDHNLAENKICKHSTHISKCTNATNSNAQRSISTFKSIPVFKWDLKFSGNNSGLSLIFFTADARNFKGCFQDRTI